MTLQKLAAFKALAVMVLFSALQWAGVDAYGQAFIMWESIALGAAAALFGIWTLLYVWFYKFAK